MTQVIPTNNTQNTQAASPATLNEVSKQWVDWILANGANGFASIINAPAEANCKDALNRIPRFDCESHPEVICLYMGFESSRFEEGQIQLCLYLFDRNSHRGGWWTGSLSQQYCKGNDADKTYFQKTIAQLEKVGVTINDKNNPNWMVIMTQVINKTFPVWVAEKESKDNGRKYYIVQSLGDSDFAAPAPVAWPAMPTQAATAPAASIPAPAAVPVAPTMPVAAQPQVRVPQANPFLNPQA